MFTSHSRGHVTIFSKFLSGAALGFVLLSGGSAGAAGFTAKLQAQSFGNTNWSTASATGWSGGDLVPTRVLMTAGPAAGQTINVTFNHTKTSGGKVTFGFEDLLQFTNSANVVITSAPTLNAPADVDDWSYTFTINLTDANPGFVEFRSELFISAATFVGASLNLAGTPALGIQPVIKPVVISGQPDLAIVKLGATNANPGQVINYSLSYSNRLSSVTATNVEVTDILPSSFVTLLSCSNCTQVGNFITWHLGTLPRGAKGKLIYSALVTNTATAGQTFANDVQIGGPQADTNTVDNESIVTTTVVLPCIRPTIAQQPESATNCAGNSQTFVVVANGTNPLRYRWRKNTVLIGGATNSTYSIASLVASNAGNYDVIVSNACGTVTSAAAVLTVTPAPTCSITGASNVCPSTTALVYTNAGAASAPTYSWSVTGNGTIVGSTSNASVTVNAGASGSFTLMSTITDGVTGCDSTCSKVVTISDTTAPTITQCATNISASANASCQAVVPSFTNAVVASDNCSVVTISQVPTIGTLVGLGTNTVTIRVGDLNGNTNTCTAKFIVRDTTVPTITQCATNISASANASCQAAVLNFTNAVVASDSCSAVSISQVPTIGTLVGLGTNTVTLRVADLNGNTNTCTASFIVRDTTAPTITTCATNISASANASCQAAVPNFTNAVVASDSCSGVTISQSPVIGALVGFGTNTVTLQVADLNGNTNTCTAKFIVRDTTAPTITTCATNITGSANASCQAAVPNFTNAVVASDSCSAVSITQSPVIGALVGLGTNTVTLRVADLNGNTNTCTASFIVRDTTAPTITQCATNISASANASCQAAVPNFTNAVVATDNCSATAITQSPTIGTLVGLGTNTVTITATDVAGNFNTCTASFIVRDTTMPTITTCATNITGSANAGCQAAVPTFTNAVVASDSCGAVSITQSPVIGALVGLGTNTVTIRVADTNGNTNTCTASFVVVDTTAPTITTCATNLTGSANAGCQAAVPNFTNAVVASDNCSATTVSQSPTIGTLVGLGTNTVTIRVADLNGNTNTCTASFIVSDTTVPTITCPANVTVNADNGACVATGVNLGSPVAADNCGVADVTNNAPASFPVGTNTVTWTATDNSGNQATCQQQVIVSDTQPPTITCPADVSVNTDNGLCTASGVSLGSPTTGDNCGVASVTNDATANFSIGTNTVTWTITDIHNNTANCAQKVIVVDNQPPTITCPFDKSVLALPGHTNIVVNYAADTSDNCSVAAVVCVPASGSAFPIGVTTVSCTVTDNAGLTASCSFTITVKAVNAAPVANNDSYATDEGTPLTVAAPGVLGNDTDAEGDPLTAVLANPPAHGTIVLNLEGSFVYAPTAGFVGTDTFKYRANDRTENSGIAIVTIIVNAVNHAPLALADSYATDTNTPLNVTAPGVLANDIDLEGDTLAAIQVGSPAHGSVTFTGDGSFLFTPDTGYVGFDSFAYAATDGASTSAPVAIVIAVGLNDNEPLAGGDDYTTDEDTPLVVDAVSGVLTNDTDPNGDPLTAILVSGPAHGAVTLNADGSFTYTPKENYNGSDFFIYRANDGTVNSSDAIVTLTVNSVNDAPEAGSVAYSTRQNTTLNVAAPGVLSSTIDIDGDAVTAVLVSNVTQGTLTMNPDGSFTYTPDTNFTGAVSFMYAATDGTTTSTPATATIHVSDSDRVPVANNDSYATDEDTVLDIPVPGLLANDTDADGDILTTIADSPTHGSATVNPNSSFTYTPDPDFNGTDSFTYKVYDGTFDSGIARVFITVNPVNDAPVVLDSTPSVPEDGSLFVPAPGALAGAYDVDGNPITAILITNVSNGTLNFNADGSYDYTPTPLFSGTDCFTFAATDGMSTSQFSTVCVTVNHVNHPPVVQDQTPAVNEDTPLNVPAPGVLTGANDVDNDPISAILIAQASNGVAVVNSDGSYSYTPNANFNGTDCFTFAATDGVSTSAFATVCVTVNAINDAPVAGAASYTVAEDDTLDVPAPGLLTHVTDVDSTTLTVSLVTQASNGVAMVNADGSFTYLPDNNFNGTDTFTYRASDGSLQSVPAPVTITVTSVSGAGDIDLLAGSASFTQSRAVANRDRLRIKGKINPRGANTSLAGATMLVTVNGLDLSAPVTLDATGRAAVQVGAKKITALLSSATGKYSFAISGADLNAALGLPNTTGSGLTVLNISMRISNANLDIPVVAGDFETPFSTTVGKSSKGRFNFKKNRTLSGVFNSNKTTAKFGKNGGYIVSFNGAIENENNASIIPTGNIHIQIGNEVMDLAPGASSAAGVKKFLLAPAKHSFRLSTTELADTLIPLPGTDAATSHRLPMMLLIPTGVTTNVFETIIELKRPDGTATKWSR